MKARNDVVVINYENEEQLNTENLVWDQRNKKIIANSFLKITTPDKVIYGDSLHAHESFKSRDIFIFSFLVNNSYRKIIIICCSYDLS